MEMVAFALFAVFFVVIWRAWSFLLAVPLTIGLLVGDGLIFDNYGRLAEVVYLIAVVLFGLYSWSAGSWSTPYQSTGRFGYGRGDIPPPSPKGPDGRPL